MARSQLGSDALWARRRVLLRHGPRYGPEVAITRPAGITYKSTIIECHRARTFERGREWAALFAALGEQLSARMAA